MNIVAQTALDEPCIRVTISHWDGYGWYVSVEALDGDETEESKLFPMVEREQAEAYFNGLCAAHSAHEVVECDYCAGKGGREYRETHGLSYADRWGRAEILIDTCPRCKGRGKVLA